MDICLLLVWGPFCEKEDRGGGGGGDSLVMEPYLDPPLQMDP